MYAIQGHIWCIRAWLSSPRSIFEILYNSTSSADFSSPLERKKGRKEDLTNLQASLTLLFLSSNWYSSSSLSFLPRMIDQRILLPSEIDVRHLRAAYLRRWCIRAWFSSPRSIFEILYNSTSSADFSSPLERKKERKEGGREGKTCCAVGKKGFDFEEGIELKLIRPL